MRTAMGVGLVVSSGLLISGLLVSSALGQGDATRPLRAKVRPINPEEMKEFEPEPDSHVLEGLCPGVVDSWTMMRLRLRGSDRECIAVVSREGLEVRRLSGDSWQTVARVPSDLFEDDLWDCSKSEWATGDVNNDGWDEVVICAGDTMRVLSWNGTGFRARNARLPGPVEQVRVGDVDGDRKNELVFFAPDVPPKGNEGSRYHVMVTRWAGGRLRKVWDDGMSLGYAHRNMPDYLMLIADVKNVGYGQVLVSREQSDVSPTDYDLLVWNKAGRLERTDSFQISDHVVPGRGHIHSTLSVCGRIRACDKEGTTYLSAVRQVQGKKYSESHSVLLRLRGDSLLDIRTMFKPFAEGSCFVNPDGKGIGLLLIWRPMFEEYPLYRFFRI